MKRDEAIPELIANEESARRKTTELCGHACARLRCMLPKNHDGLHESLATMMTTRWNDAGLTP